MTNTIKTDVINSLISSSYFWMGEYNWQSALSIIKMLYQVKLTTVQGKKVDDLYHDFKTFFTGKYDEKKFTEIKIPEEYDDEKKLLYISSNVVMNMFNAGLFEIGYTTLMEMSLNWNELYINVIAIIKKQSFYMEISDWLMTHFFMAIDILGEKEIESMGYKITKIKK